MCRVLYTTTIMCCWIICPATRNRHGGELYIGAAVYSFCYPVIVAISLEKRYLYFSSFFVLFLSFDNFLFSHVQFLHYIVALASAIITADFKTIRWCTTTWIDGYRYYYYFTVGRGKGSLCCCCSRATAFVGLRFGRVGGNRRLLCHARPLTQKGGDGPCI
jgi:hypothetical protein